MLTYVPLLGQGRVVEDSGHDSGTVVRAVGPDSSGDVGEVGADSWNWVWAVQHHTQLTHSLI